MFGLKHFYIRWKIMVLISFGMIIEELVILRICGLLIIIYIWILEEILLEEV